MTRLTKSLLIALCLAGPFGQVALAQTADTTAQAPAAANDAGGTSGDLSMGTPAKPADGPGTTYTEATFDAWEQRCLRTADGSNPCQLYQLLKDEKGNSVAEFSMFPLPAGQQAVAGATIVVPLETLLPAALTLTIDTAQPRRYPFTFCTQMGCIARVGFTQPEIDSLKNGKVATLTIVPAAAPDQKVNLNVSLKGFTAGFEAVAKTVQAPKK